MKTENLLKAYHSAQFLAREIREAHTDAVNSGNQFAEIALFDLIGETVKLEDKLKRLTDAAAPADSGCDSCGMASRVPGFDSCPDCIAALQAEAASRGESLTL